MPYIVQIIIPAFLLDCLLGDPQNPLHPVRIIGRVISCCVKAFRYTKIKQPAIEFAAGLLLTVSLVVGVFLLTWHFLAFLHGIHPGLAYGAEVILCYFIIAPRALRDESMKVYECLKVDNLTEARSNLSRIVGRDTERLDQSGVVRAAVETVAENFSDGVIAPLFFVCLGGVPLGMAYKTVNTLDSMIGYRNEKYEYFGKFAARLDDAANYIPSRLSALFLLIAALITKADVQRAFRIYRRDRLKHKSPNSAQTEAVCAGTLGLQLGGDGFYGGKLVSKPIIGDPIVSPAASHIVAVNRQMYVATLVGILFLSIGTAVFQAAWRYCDV